MHFTDDVLANLAPEDLGRVRRWIEDRFINAVCPLAFHLNREMPWMLGADRTLQEAQRAVERVLAAVEEIRRIDGEARAYFPRCSSSRRTQRRSLDAKPRHGLQTEFIPHRTVEWAGVTKSFPCLQSDSARTRWYQFPRLA